MGSTGTMEGVCEDFLLQTFDKKVMSHLRKKKTEHELVYATPLLRHAILT